MGSMAARVSLQKRPQPSQGSMVVMEIAVPHAGSMAARKRDNYFNKLLLFSERNDWSANAQYIHAPCSFRQKKSH